MITWPDLRFPPINLWNAPGCRARVKRIVPRKPQHGRPGRILPQQRIKTLLAGR